MNTFENICPYFSFTMESSNAEKRHKRHALQDLSLTEYEPVHLVTVKKLPG